MGTIRRVGLAAACAVLTSTTTLAQPAQVLGLHEAIAEALTRNPEIAAAQLRYDAARLRPVQERSLPDPMVSAGYTSAGRPWPGAGLGSESGARIGAMVTQPLPYPGKLQLRGVLADRDADAMAKDIEAARLDITSRVKQAYYRLAASYAIADTLTRNRDLLNTLLAVSESRYSVGNAAQQDVIKAQTQLSILELQLERTAQARRAREGELKSLLGRAYTDAIGRPEPLDATAFTLSLDAIIDSASAYAPMLRKGQILIDRAATAIEAARREFKPDFALSGGYSYQGSMPDMYEVRVDVQLPLQRAKRAAAVSEQRTLAAAAQRTFDADRLSLIARVTEDYQMTATASRLALLYRDTVLPQARLALESSLASYQTGGVDFLSVLTNFSTVLEYEMTYYDELAAYHVAVSRLEAMAGVAVTH